MSKTLTFNQRWLRATMNLFVPSGAIMIVSGLAAILLEAPRAVCIVCVVVAVICLGMSVALGYDRAKEKE